MILTIHLGGPRGGGNIFPVTKGKSRTLFTISLYSRDTTRLGIFGGHDESSSYSPPQMDTWNHPDSTGSRAWRDQPLGFYATIDNVGTYVQFEGGRMGPSLKRVIQRRCWPCCCGGELGGGSIVTSSPKPPR